MATARRLTARLPRLPDSTPQQVAAAVAVVRAGIGQLWPQVPPEAVCAVLLAAAELAVVAGVSAVPQAAAAGFAAGHLDGADGMLQLTGEWLAAGRPRRRPRGVFAPPFAFATSVAFDRDADDQTLTSLAVLLTLAHLVFPPARSRP